MTTVGYHIVDVSVKKSVDLNSGTNPCYEGEEDYEVAEYRALGEQLRSAHIWSDNRVHALVRLVLGTSLAAPPPLYPSTCARGWRFVLMPPLELRWIVTIMIMIMIMMTRSTNT